MLFNSYTFIFVFLPVTLLGFYMTARLGRRFAALWLVAASVFFYGWWNPKFVVLLLGSIAFNYTMSRLVAAAGTARPGRQSALLAAGITGNLLLLFFYKYMFALMGFLGLLDALPGSWAQGVILPLGISFFTFTQIGYLVDSKEGMVKQHGPLDFLLFVTFFPHLIAGPILHNQEMIPQFADPATYRFRLENLTVGFSLFVIGLCKKVVIADPLGQIADPGFSAPHALASFGAWQTVLSYSLQLYFDFSGYSDMAIGIARMFGIRFPLNFNSPYKARSIIDFWQRWHMTLTRYLNLYLYNPIALRITRRRMARGLGVSRAATRNWRSFASMTMLPTFFTMLLAGVWHGAGFQFFIFGLLHAVYLSVNHAWRVFGPAAKKGKNAGKGKAPPPEPGLGKRLAGIGLGAASVLLTYSAVLVAQIFFRANSSGDAASMLGGVLGLHAAESHVILPVKLTGLLHRLLGAAADSSLFAYSDAAQDLKAWARIAAGFAIVWCLPNSQQIMADFAPALGTIKPGRFRFLTWRPGFGWGLATAALLLLSLFNLDNVSRFLYFQF
jgi:D-alanyl-lipoteichoic acid acyltransferase DltB (MBOAT superfamily)